MRLSRVTINGVDYVRAKAIEGEAAVLRSVAKRLERLSSTCFATGRGNDGLTLQLAAQHLSMSAERLDLGAGGDSPPPAGWDYWFIETLTSESLGEDED